MNLNTAFRKTELRLSAFTARGNIILMTNNMHARLTGCLERAPQYYRSLFCRIFILLFCLDSSIQSLHQFIIWLYKFIHGFYFKLMGDLIDVYTYFF